MKREFSAGGVVYRRIGDSVEWIVIKPRPSTLFPKIRFCLPKGHLEKDESSQQAAIREVFEEAGIVAKIISKVGISKYVFTSKKEKIFKVVTYFLMEYISGKLTENEEVEELFFLPFEEAIKKLTYSDDKKILKNAATLLEI